MTLRKTIYLLGVSLALLALVVFATGVVSDWNHHSSTDEGQCPYCHMGHQAPVQLRAAQSVFLLKLVGSLALPEVSFLAATSNFTRSSPRAPPA
jgi:hypothetical protein